VEIPPAGSARIEVDGRTIELTQLDLPMWPVAA
jgi:hypothetical protein